ncbi:hypothetical protein PAMC26577_00675 [Caballeronia sordidicola]|uniref:Uncharacterized protein n=1 Tax=Caballeronia sordidicola TaxID=196367 RepID=A0A242N711_CABSO|nr:hypothetical protein PAMC26577_00675 [Caballeronia sordidicola]
MMDALIARFCLTPRLRRILDASPVVPLTDVDRPRLRGPSM